MTARLSWAPVARAAEVFTPEFTALLLSVHDRFAAALARVRDARAAVLAAVLDGDRTAVEELDELTDALGDQMTSTQRERYERSAIIAEHWIADYLALDFRSLGSWTRTELIHRADRVANL